MPSILENQKATTEKFMQHEETWDYNESVKLRTDDCKYQLLPKSLGQPERNNDEFKEFYAQFAPIWQEYKITIIKTIHDPESHQSLIHINNNAGSPVGKFDIETIWMLEFNEDCTKVNRVEEYLDTEYFNKWLAKLMDAQSSDAASK